jgi:hypothetical protein
MTHLTNSEAPDSDGTKTMFLRNGIIGKLPRIVHSHAHPVIHGSLVTAHLRVDRNDSSTAADLQHFQRTVSLTMSRVHPAGKPAEMFRTAEELNCCAYFRRCEITT